MDPNLKPSIVGSGSPLKSPKKVSTPKKSPSKSVTISEQPPEEIPMPDFGPDPIQIHDVAKPITQTTKGESMPPLRSLPPTSPSLI